MKRLDTPEVRSELDYVSNLQMPFHPACSGLQVFPLERRVVFVAT
jgi:hypothetical protein